MKKLLILALLVVALCFSTSSYGQDDSGRRGYVGIGASYIWEDADLDSINVFGTIYEPDFEDTWGINVKIGGYVTNWMSLEMNFDYLFKSEWDESQVVLGIPIKTEFDVEVWTVMLLAKFSADTGTGMPKPFLVAGGGIMHVELEGKATALGVSASASDDEADLCVKLGIGADYFATENVSIGLEGAYVWGLNDLDEVRYFDLTLGVAYHF